MKKFPIIFSIVVLIVLPLISLAQGPAPSCTPGQAATSQLCNPINASDAIDFIQKLFGFVAGVIGLLSIIMLILSGTRMIISQGDQKALSQAKTGFQYTIVGLIISIFAYVIVAGTQLFIRANPITSSDISGAVWIINPLKDKDLMSFILSSISNFLSIVGTLALLIIVWNGLRYVTARGNEEQTKSARAGILWALMGLILIILSYVVIQAVVNFF